MTAAFATTTFTTAHVCRSSDSVRVRPHVRPTGIVASSPRRVSRRTSGVDVNTYRRRRAVVGGILAVVTACGVVLVHDVLASSGGVPASAAPSSPAPVRATVVAQPGDSLWSIAQAHAGDVSITRYLDKLVEINGGPSIQAGQLIVLP